MSEVSSRVEKILSGSGADSNWDGTAHSRIEADIMAISGKGEQSEKSAKEIAEINAKILGMYKNMGEVAFADLPDPTTGIVGANYNVTDSFITDDRFIEGAGVRVDAGTDISVIYDPDDTTKAKFNLFNVASEPVAIPVEDLKKMWEDD